MIEVKCPHCSAEMEVPDSLKGSWETCPDCKKTFFVTDDPRKELVSQTSSRKSGFRPVSKSTTETILEVWGSLLLILSLVAAIFVTAISEGTRTTVVGILYGFGIAVYGLISSAFIFAIVWTLRYLREILSELRKR